MLLDVRDLTFRPSEEINLRHVSFSVDRGECVVIRSPILLLGTRLLQALIGLEDTLVGEVWFEGHDMVAPLSLRRRLMLRRHIGYVHRVGGLISLLNVRENLMLPLSYHERIEQSRVAEMTNELSHSLGIAHLLDHQVEDLDALQTRLANLARALITGPRLLLVDAILEGMQEEQIEKVVAVINRYREIIGFAVVMTARSRTFPLANRVYELRDTGLHRLDT